MQREPRRGKWGDVGAGADALDWPRGQLDTPRPLSAAALACAGPGCSSSGDEDDREPPRRAIPGGVRVIRVASAATRPGTAILRRRAQRWSCMIGVLPVRSSKPVKTDFIPRSSGPTLPRSPHAPVGTRWRATPTPVARCNSKPRRTPRPPALTRLPAWPNLPVHPRFRGAPGAAARLPESPVHGAHRPALAGSASRPRGSFRSAPPSPGASPRRPSRWRTE